MVCANWLLTIFAVVILVFTFWQTTASQWLIVIAAILTLIVAWTGVKCKYCPESKPAARPAARPARKKKR